ncbi:RNA polymerase sigma factor [Thalassotalea nanhaiensis]|uniref:RNA polymerase sigma factor n=1 Tax=Thalassotalea nanhaiensis TaxID=3065648 RepID=A0ABY9TKY4_9GAMM|nr:RNA polymerase sigma factor [Colwelliaceae bacterium SQ345]
MVKLPSIMKGGLNTTLTNEQVMLKLTECYDSKYLTRLIEQFNDDLYHYLLSQSDKYLAEDIVQTVWLKVIEKRHSYRIQTSVKSWLFSIARNCLIDELRRQQRWKFDDNNDDIQVIEVNYEELLANEKVEQIFNYLLEQLPFSQKEAFILQQEGFSLEDISSICNDKTETIKSRLRYARAHFKRHMELLDVK